MAGANIGLSMLSRGIGEEKQIKGHRKLEVSLEPEDYHNIQSKKFYLPPIQQHAWQNGNIVNREMMTHKTFTTRKGALLLYAEDLASVGGGATDAKKKALEAEDSSLFSSTNEFCSAILSYGAKGNESSPIFLNFVKGRSVLEASRSVRPGFSAKRYMANWSRSWDDSVLNKLRSNGNIWDKNLFQPNAVNPSMYRRINDDLSQYPSPYHVTRSMLLSPGGLQQYEFYRIKSNISDEEITEETEEEVLASTKQPPPAKGNFIDSNSIAVVERDKENKPHLVSYKDLDEEKQTAVLQRLLVQSVLSHQQSIEDLLHEKLSSVSTKSESGSVLESPLNLDIEQAIIDLITSNSTQLQVGNPVFTDASYIKTSPTQLKAQPDKRAHSHNSGRGQYSTLPPINNIPALRPLKAKPLGGGVFKLPPLPTKSGSPHSGSHYRPEETQSNGWESNFASDDSEHWQGNVVEEVKKSKDKLKKLGSHKSSSDNSVSKVSAPDVDLSVTVGKSMHGSLESIAQPSNDISIGVKGGYMPKWQEKSMITHKTSVKSSSSSVVMGPDGDMLAIGSSYVHSLASASEFGNDDANEDVIIDQEETQSMSSSKIIKMTGEGTGNIPLDTSQKDSAEALLSHEIGDVDVYDKTQSGRQGVAAEDAVILNGEPESTIVQPERAVMHPERVLEQPKNATTAGDGDVKMNQDDVKQSINEDGKAKEDKDGDDGQPVRDNEETDLARSGQPANKVTPEIPVVDVEASNGIKEEQESVSAKDGVEEAETSSSRAENDDGAKQVEHDREPGENGSVVSAASVMEDIVEQALKVAETVIQRPKSGRDLAADAKEAAGMWAEQLKNIFSENSKKLERSASETLRFRSWSSNSVSSTDSFGVGYWVRQSSKAKDKDKSKLRVHSAEAAISVIKNFINHKEFDSKGEEIAKFITPDKEDHIVDGSGDASKVKSSRNVAAKHSASTRSFVSEKTGTQATSLEFDVTSYQANKKEEPKSNTVVKEEGRSPSSVKEVDDDTKEFQEAIDKIVKETGLLEKDKKTQKQKKTKKQLPKSPPSEKIDQNEQLDERERFIVGKPKEQKKPEEPIAKKTKTKKVVKKEKKKVEKKTKPKKKTPSEKDKTTNELEEKEITSPAKEVEEVPKAATEGLENEDDASKKVAQSSPDVMSVDRSVSEKSSETPESPQFIIIHDEFSDSESEERTSNSEVKSMTPLDDSYSEVRSSVMSSVTEDSTSQGPQSISRSQAKQAKRAAEAERRKQEVERKRKEREEAKRKSLEEAERREQLKREFEEERRRKEEEIRERREREIEEKRKKEEAALEKKRQAQLALERERKQREERQRKMNEMARKKREEELKKKEEAERERKEEEERRKAEEEMLAAMAEEERLEYEKKKLEEELLQKELAEKERLQREEEARIAQEEAERLILLKLKEQKELEARLQFNRLLQSESNIMAHSQDMTRAFTFSYYELLEALGIDPPEWLKKELQEYT